MLGEKRAAPELVEAGATTPLLDAAHTVVTTRIWFGEETREQGDEATA